MHCKGRREGDKHMQSPVIGATGVAEPALGVFDGSRAVYLYSCRQSFLGPSMPSLSLGLPPRRLSPSSWYPAARFISSSLPPYCCLPPPRELPTPAPSWLDTWTAWPPQGYLP